MVKAANSSKQAEEIKTSDVVIWACGYESNHVPIFVSKGPLNLKYEPLELSRTANAQYSVDNKMKIKIKNPKSPVYKLYGIGLGYA